MDKSWIAFIVLMILASLTAISATVLTSFAFQKKRELVTIHDAIDSINGKLTITEDLSITGNLVVTNANRSQVEVTNVTTLNNLTIRDAFSSVGWDVGVDDCPHYFDSIYWFRLQLEQPTTPSALPVGGCFPFWKPALFQISGPTWPSRLFATPTHSDTGMVVTQGLPDGDWLFHLMLQITADSGNFSVALSLFSQSKGPVLLQQQTSVGKSAFVTLWGHTLLLNSEQLMIQVSATQAATNAVLNQCVIWSQKIG
jgi:hypothetical protein